MGSDMVQRERDLVIDIESEEEGNNDTVSMKYLGRIISVDDLIEGEIAVRSSSNSDLFTDKSSGEDNVALLANKTIKEKRKKTGTNKPPKPPRPPGAPLLDAADQKLVREISELAMLKRARRERMKAHKKLKAAKALSSSSLSSNTSLCAMIVTLLFCLIIILQGMFSKNSSHTIFDGSPESTAINRGALISVQYYKNPSASSTNPSSGSPNLVEQVSGSSPEE